MIGIVNSEGSFVQDKNLLWQKGTTMTEQKELNILEQRIEDLQLRNGWAVLGVFDQGAICYVVAKDNIGAIQAGHRKRDGRVFNNFIDDLDVILKPKNKIIKAPFYFQNPDGSIDIHQTIATEQDAQTSCKRWNCKLIKWLGDTPLAIECDEE